tara:strand:+ start:1442 stop:1720 length:279 start_codon:yes stop_codon:yes gene_type:complete
LVLKVSAICYPNAIAKAITVPVDAGGLFVSLLIATIELSLFFKNNLPSAILTAISPCSKSLADGADPALDDLFILRVFAIRMYHHQLQIYLK